MFETILVPVDDTEVSAKAVTTAVKFAQEVGGTLTLLHCLEPLPTYTGNVAGYLPEGELERAAKEYGQSILDKFAGQLPYGGDHQIQLHQGDKKAWREIVDYAEAQNIELIIMGSHGRTGLEHALLGSVAERVARHTDIPVMLIS
ncbi:MAG: universal stress protein [Deinococcota bacterium]